ncbi:hypothetical protein N9S30_00050 [bacterium]|nr:hypothetical protein [bacterium]
MLQLQRLLFLLDRSDDIEAFVKREPELLTWTDRDHRKNIEHFFTAVRSSFEHIYTVHIVTVTLTQLYACTDAQVDPSGGGPSAFAICSVICLPNGSIQVRLVKQGKRQGKGERHVEPVSRDALVGVQQAERAAETNERIRTLSQVFDKGWGDQRENAFGQILHQRAVGLLKLCRKLRLLPESEKQHGPLA